MAADLPEQIIEPVSVPSFSWSGAYIGVFAGAALPSERVRVRDRDGYNAVGAFGYKIDDSFTGGLTLGYNHQLDNSPIVFGLEGELGYLDLNGKRRDPAGPGGDSTSRVKSDKFYATLSGRVGFAFDRFLVFGKAGVAYVDKKASFRDNCSIGACGPLTINASKSGDDFTWTVGGGVEYAVTDNISVKGEYTYIATGETLNVRGVDSAAVSRRFSTRIPDTHIVKAGVNYRFNW